MSPWPEREYRDYGSAVLLLCLTMFLTVLLTSGFLWVLLNGAWIGAIIIGGMAFFGFRDYPAIILMSWRWVRWHRQARRTP